jgi:hypothetical protein
VPGGGFRDLVPDQGSWVDGLGFAAGGLQASAGLVVHAMSRARLVPERLAERGSGETPVGVAGATRPIRPLYCIRWNGGAALLPIEGDRCLVNRFGDRPPTASEDCIAFTESLEAPEILDRVRHTEQAVAGKRVNIPQSWVTWFDQVSGCPLGLLPLGDVIGVFNPFWSRA